MSPILYVQDCHWQETPLYAGHECSTRKACSKPYTLLSRAYHNTVDIRRVFPIRHVLYSSIISSAVPVSDQPPSQNTYCFINQHELAFISLRRRQETTYRDKQVRDPLLVLLPRGAVLEPTPLHVSVRAMDDHAAKEQWIEPWKRRVETCDCAPRDGKVEIGRVMDLPFHSVSLASKTTQLQHNIPFVHTCTTRL